jgi:hypothetical protein
VPVENVIGRDVIQAARGGLVAPFASEYAPDDEVDDQAADGAEEFGDLHELARLIHIFGQ